MSASDSAGLSVAADCGADAASASGFAVVDAAVEEEEPAAATVLAVEVVAP